MQTFQTALGMSSFSATPIKIKEILDTRLPFPLLDFMLSPWEHTALVLNAAPPRVVSFGCICLLPSPVLVAGL